MAGVLWRTSAPEYHSVLMETLPVTGGHESTSPLVHQGGVL